MKAQAFTLPSSLLLLVSAVLHAAGKGKVTLAIEAERNQPSGWPVVVEVTVTNAGKNTISWWCGGPGSYPGAEHFAVEVRYGPNTVWHKVQASNGQYVEISGTDRQLASGAQVVAPLAVPVQLPDSGDILSKRDGNLGSLHVRVATREWAAEKPAEAYVTVWSRREHIDKCRQRIVQAVLTGTSSFWRHLGEQYPDEVVLDTMHRLVTVDCRPIVVGAARLLARQPTLPESCGDALADAVRLWVPQEPTPQCGGPADLGGQCGAQNKIGDSPSSRAQGASRNGLTRGRDGFPSMRFANRAWFARARAAIQACQQQSPDDGKLAREAERATEWLDSRLQHGQ